jgi:PKD repeat protein
MNVDSHSSVINPMLDDAHLCQPLAGSPAIDGGELLDNPFDYEMHARPQGTAFDIGAYEKMASGAANQPPTVSITATATTGTAPLNVAFTTNAADPEGQPLTYAWQFGDGLVSSVANPAHLYQSTGVFTARCTVTDAGGLTATAQLTITVSSAPVNQPPTVSITVTPTSGTSPLTVAFTTTASDPEGQAMTYAWEFGDGTVSSTKNPSHIYSTVGVFTARCKVTDAGGANATAQVTITVTDVFQDPVVNMITPDGGEVIDGGSTYTIRWTATGTGLGRTDVAYSMDGGVTWTDIVNSLTFITSLDWVVPNVKGKAFRIRVVVYGPRGTGQDMSARNFQVVKVKKPQKKAKSQ